MQYMLNTNKNKEACPRPAPGNPGTNLVFIFFEGISEHFLLPDLRSRSFNRLWTSFFYRICEANPLTAFGLGIWTNLVLTNLVFYILVFKLSLYSIMSFVFFVRRVKKN